MMDTLEEIIGQYDRKEYDADCRKIMALIQSGVPVKFTKLGAGADKTIRTEIKAKIVSKTAFAAAKHLPWSKRLRRLNPLYIKKRNIEP